LAGEQRVLSEAGATVQMRGSVGARDSLDLELYNTKPNLRRCRGGGGRCGRSNEGAASEKQQRCMLSAASAEPLWNDWTVAMPPLYCRETVRPAWTRAGCGLSVRGRLCGLLGESRERSIPILGEAWRRDGGLQVTCGCLFMRTGLLFTAPWRLATIGGSAGPIWGKSSYHHQRQTRRVDHSRTSVTVCCPATAWPEGAWPCDLERCTACEGMLVVDVPCAAHDRLAARSVGLLRLLVTRRAVAAAAAAMEARVDPGTRQMAAAAHACPSAHLHTGHDDSNVDDDDDSSGGDGPAPRQIDSNAARLRGGSCC
jgi:hypothetical protein